MSLRVAVVVSHPIQHFAPWHREIAAIEGIDLKVLFCCDWGVNEYHDPQFGVKVKWDVPLLEGYEHEFLPIKRRPERLSFMEVDNPQVGEALDRFRPDVVQVFGYARRTNWRVVSWARRRRVPVLLYSDSHAGADATGLRRLAKRVVVGRFYRQVSGALYCGDNNLAYHLRYGMPRDRLFPGGLPIDRRRLLASVPDPSGARRRVRARHQIPDDAFVVVSCGKYVPHKRPLDLAMAVEAVSRSGGNAWALLVGEGPERTALEDYCKRQNVRNCTLTGFVNQAQIGEYYAAADTLAVPSSSDAHPLAVSEGGSFGLPVIVSDRVGCVGQSDTARPGENAVVYPCGDVGELAGRIEQLWADDQLRQRMALRSLEISATQDVAVLARDFAFAVHRLHELGPR